MLGLRKSSGEKEAVAGIDLEITAGSFAGLVGPNGAGKTTSLSMMTGLLRPDGGRVLIRGIDVWADPPAAKAAIGVVPAEARLFDRLSGAELLEYAGRLRGLPAGEARSRAAQLLDVLDLTADAKRLVADYSTGMRKKAALGCALIHNPSVLFLDEPLEGVDPVSADAIRRLLTSFVGSGSTVLFSSHVMELVEQVCDHVSIISQGRIVATGTTEQVRGGQTLQRAFIDLVGSHAQRGGIVMARLLVQLKLRLLANALHSSTPAKVSFVVSTAIAGLTAAGTFVVLALLRGQSTSVDCDRGHLHPVRVRLADPAAARLRPGRHPGPGHAGPVPAAHPPARRGPAGRLGRRRVAAGQRARAARSDHRAGPWRPRPARRAGRGTAAGAVLHHAGPVRDHRDGRAAPLPARQGLRRLPDRPDLRPVRTLHAGGAEAGRRRAADRASFAGVDAWLRWLPPGLAAHAIQDASDGHPLTALLRLALLAAVIAVLGGLWIRSLGRALIRADSSTQSAQVRATALPLARYGLRGAVAARFWIYQRREPVSLVYWCITGVIMIAASVSTLIGPQRHLGVLFLSAILGAGFVGVFHGNSVGATGPAFVVEATALTDRSALRAYLSGQNISLAVIGAPLLAALSFALAALAGSPGYGFLTTPVALAGLGAALGLGSIDTITIPYPMDKRLGNATRGAAAGYTSYGVGSTFGILLGVAVLAAPVIVAAVLTSTGPAAVRIPALAACAAAYGLALAWAGVRIAARAAEGKLPELCQVAIRSRP